MKKTVRTLHIGLTEREAKIIEKIEETSFLAEVIRELIRNYGKEHFPEEPGYVQVKKAELELRKQKMEFDAVPIEERLRKNFNFKVRDGMIYSLTYIGVWGTPLSDAKHITKESKLVTRHNLILNAIEKNEPLVENGQTKVAVEDLQKLKQEWDEVVG